MALIGDLVLQTANAPGTATFSLIAPATGRVSFVAGNGAGQAYYIATDGTSWEKGYGTVVAGSPDTLSRDTVIRNNLGTTAKINFTSTVTILSDVPAERAIYAIADNGSVAMAGRAITGLGAAFAADHAPRLDQIAWERVSPTDTVVSSGTTVAVFSLATGTYEKFRLEWANLAPAIAAAPFARFSQDGGSTYKAGTTDYNFTSFTISGGVGTPATSAGSFGQLGGTQNASTASTGWLEIDPVNYIMDAGCVGQNSSGMLRYWNGFNVALTAPPTHVQFGVVNTTMSAGRLRLLGWR